MDINRHNYETYFLLYVDNELPAAERTAVELFVRENPDLAPELELLGGTILPQEITSFEHKSDLLRKDEVSAWQEKMLLQLDAELGKEDSDSLFKAMDADKNLAQEWNILQQTKLDKNETIVFENKASLYRKESGRIVAMRFRRMAIAAAVTGLLLMAAVFVFRKPATPVDTVAKTSEPVKQTDKENSELAAQGNTDNSVKKEDALLPADAIQNNTTVNNSASDQLTAMNNRKISDKPTVKQPVAPVRVKQQQLINDNNNSNTVAAQLKGQDKVVDTERKNRSLENINNKESNNIASSTVDKKEEALLQRKVTDGMVATNQQEKTERTIQPLTSPDIEITALTPNRYASTASMDNLQQEQKEDKVLFMNEEKVSRSKISGFIRKVKRVIERKANIKTGNGIKIAGFEIAAR